MTARFGREKTAHPRREGRLSSLFSDESLVGDPPRGFFAARARSATASENAGKASAGGASRKSEKASAGGASQKVKKRSAGGASRKRKGVPPRKRFPKKKRSAPAKALPEKKKGRKEARRKDFHAARFRIFAIGLAACRRAGQAMVGCLRKRRYPMLASSAIVTMGTKMST